MELYGKFNYMLRKDFEKSLGIPFNAVLATQYENVNALKKSIPNYPKQFEPNLSKLASHIKGNQFPIVLALTQEQTATQILREHGFATLEELVKESEMRHQ